MNEGECSEVLSIDEASHGGAPVLFSAEIL